MENTAVEVLVPPVPSQHGEIAIVVPICYIGVGEAEFEVQNVKLRGFNEKMLRRAGLQVTIVVLAGLMLAACDKCGNSIFHADASGPLVCRDQGPH